MKKVTLEDLKRLKRLGARIDTIQKVLDILNKDSVNSIGLTITGRSFHIYRYRHKEWPATKTIYTGKIDDWDYLQAFRRFFAGDLIRAKAELSSYGLDLEGQGDTTALDRPYGELNLYSDPPPPPIPNEEGGKHE